MNWAKKFPPLNEQTPEALRACQQSRRQMWLIISPAEDVAKLFANVLAVVIKSDPSSEGQGRSN